MLTGAHLATCDQEVGIVQAGQALVLLPGLLDNLLAQLQARFAHGRTDGGHGERPTLQRRLWQGGVAKQERDIGHVEARGIGSDLRHDGIGAGADVRGGAADSQVPVTAQTRLGAGLHLHGFPYTAGHAPAYALIAVPHRAGRSLALGPTKTLGPLCVTG